MSGGGDSGTTTIKIVSTSGGVSIDDGEDNPDDGGSVVVTTEEVVQDDGQQIYIIETTEEEEEVVQDVAVYETVSALEQLSRGGSGEVLQVYEEVVLDDDNTEFVEVEVSDGNPNSPVKVKESNGGEFNVCRVCHQFVPINDITEHNSLHHSSLKELTCVDCAKIFKSKRSLFGHRKEKHSGVTEVHVCPECGKSFGRKSNLKAHRESLHYGKKFPCSICERIFTNRSSMNQHVKKAHNTNAILS
ncbi:KRAB [Lepeophtheirus salmonis]|uniref:KRAB n=1 Tax=Lepeophtheirus salmonis TaxID=72036 RepID=A0A0K2TCN3_LEPSM|nr:zinc finger protein 875-like [Lepeophtheirus salmonis]CAB4067055.1 KRAB [Lepeophtheirus salmonis]CAF2981312.1 KRAB [Lepeophtheirus salmonis]